MSSQTPEPGHTGCSRCEDMVDGYAAPTTSVLGHVQMLRGERTRWKLDKGKSRLVAKVLLKPDEKLVNRLSDRERLLA